VGNGIGRTVGPVELRESVQLNGTAKDLTVERQGLTSSAGKMDVGRRSGHGSNVTRRLARTPCHRTTGYLVQPVDHTDGTQITTRIWTPGPSRAEAGTLPQNDLICTPRLVIA
jgi:hypothetical protein